MENKLKELIYTTIGTASMCWSETPKGTFLEKTANNLAEQLVKDIEELYATK